MLAGLKVKIFADGADLGSIQMLAHFPEIQGFTTNPTLMRKAGVEDYEAFAKRAIELVGDKPISLEVFSDDFNEMDRQARLISSWGDNVYVKIPVTDTKGMSLSGLIWHLATDGVKVNVTAVMTERQVLDVTTALYDAAPSFISVFAGRIADAGVDPFRIVRKAVKPWTNMDDTFDVIWASPREILNVVDADRAGCAAITLTSDLIAKLPTLGKDLDEFSLDTVKMFHNDAKEAGYTL